VTSDFRPEVEIQPFRACAIHPAIIGTVRSLWTWLWGSCHVPQNVFLVLDVIVLTMKQQRAGIYSDPDWSYTVSRPIIERMNRHIL